MSPLIKSHYEKLLLAGAAGAVIAGGVWAWLQQPEVHLVRAEPEQPLFTEGTFIPTEPAVEPVKHAWSGPPAQSGGIGWLYEVFTPPLIYYHASSRTFSVSSPYYSGEASEPLFGLELKTVKQAPYRLQLAGYFGTPGEYLAAFVSTEVTETLLARAGRRFEKLGLTLKGISVNKVAIETDVHGPVYDIAALAVLHDDETGEEVILDSREKKLTDTPLAVFHAPALEGRPLELHEGETFEVGTATYRIERIQLDPPEVVVAHSAPGVLVPEIRILRPVVASTDNRSDRTLRSKAFNAHPAVGIANQGP